MKVKIEIKRIPLGDLIVDSRVQGSFNPAAVKRMCADFKEESVGLLTVSARDNGEFHVMDGQHRRAALKALFGNDYMVRCEVHYGLTLADEAELFVRLNTHHAPNTKDRFRNRLVYADPDTIAIRDLVRRYGYEVSFHGTARGKITAIAALEAIYKRANGPEALDKTLWVMDSTWGRIESVTDGHIIRGLGAFFCRYGDKADKHSLSQRLAKSHTPERLLSIGRSDQKSSGGFASGIARELVRVYNSRRSVNRLDPW